MAVEDPTPACTRRHVASGEQCDRNSRDQNSALNLSVAQSALYGSELESRSTRAISSEIAVLRPICRSNPRDACLSSIVPPPLIESASCAERLPYKAERPDSWRRT